VSGEFLQKNYMVKSTGDTLLTAKGHTGIPSQRSLRKKTLVEQRKCRLVRWIQAHSGGQKISSVSPVRVINQRTEVVCSKQFKHSKIHGTKVQRNRSRELVVSKDPRKKESFWLCFRFFFFFFFCFCFCFCFCFFAFAFELLWLEF